MAVLTVVSQDACAEDRVMPVICGGRAGGDGVPGRSAVAPPVFVRAATAGAGRESF